MNEDDRVCVGVPPVGTKPLRFHLQPALEMPTKYSSDKEKEPAKDISRQNTPANLKLLFQSGSADPGARQSLTPRGDRRLAAAAPARPDG